MHCRQRSERSSGVPRAREREHPQGLGSVLDWIEQLRGLFGDPEVNREPWRGEDFRLQPLSRERHLSLTAPHARLLQRESTSGQGDSGKQASENHASKSS